MSSNNVRYMSDDDMYALIAYLRSISREQNLNRPIRYPAGFIMAGAGLIPGKPPTHDHRLDPTKAGKFMSTPGLHGLPGMILVVAQSFAPGPSLRGQGCWSSS
jgi:hypothetical protein